MNPNTIKQCTFIIENRGLLRSLGLFFRLYQWVISKDRRCFYQFFFSLLLSCWYLVDHRRDAGKGGQVHQPVRIEVGNADGTQLSFVVQILQSGIFTPFDKITYSIVIPSLFLLVYRRHHCDISFQQFRSAGIIPFVFIECCDLRHFPVTQTEIKQVKIGADMIRVL